MTYNQIMYWQTQETRRKNITDEYINFLNYLQRGKEHEETVRHNKFGESIDFGQLLVKQGELAERERSNRAVEYETARSHLANEEINWFGAKETARHNLENESISWFNAGENQRHNIASEGIQWYSAAETARANRVNEDIRQGQLNEQIRADIVNESISQQRADTAQYEAITSRQHTTRQDSISAVHYSNQDRVAEERVNLDQYIADYTREINETNAYTNRMNAAANAQNADTRAKELGYNVMTGAWNFAESRLDPMNRLGQMTGIFGNLASGAGNVLRGVSYFAE